jgi:hypothetical protein
MVNRGWRERRIGLAIGLPNDSSGRHSFVATAKGFVQAEMFALTARFLVLLAGSRAGRASDWRQAVYAIKAEISEPMAGVLAFPDQKTMYGGKKIAAGDTIYLFASENEGGVGLIARGVVVAATATPKRPDHVRQTPRVSITVRIAGLARCKLGRTELKPHKQWDDLRPETELNFKFYRQATNKIVGLSAEACEFLASRF